MKRLMARLPWLKNNQTDVCYASLYIAIDKIVSVIITREDNTWQIVQSFVEPFQNEIDKLDAIRKIIKQIPYHYPLTIVLPNNMYQIVQVEKPNLSEDEIRTSLPWTIKELVGFDATDIIADFYDSTIPQGTDKINVVASTRALLMPILNIVHECEANLVSIQPEDMTLVDMITHDNAAHMVVTQQLGTEPSLHIIREGELLLSRRLRGLMSLAEQPLLQLRNGLLDNFGLELQRSLDYFESQMKQPPIKSLQLAIPNLELSGIIDELRQFFPAKVSAFLPEQAICQQQSMEMQFALSAALSLSEGGVDENTR